MRTKNPDLKKVQEFEYALFEHAVHIPTRTIFLGDFGAGVDDFTWIDTVRAIHHFKYMNPRKQITIKLNTMGGEEGAMWGIYDEMKACRCPIKVIASGSCMSAGTIIIQAGTKRVLRPNCTYMIHDGSDGYGGEKKSFENWGKHCKHLRKTAYDVYYEHMQYGKLRTEALEYVSSIKPKSKTKKEKEFLIKKYIYDQIETLCSKDTIFTAEQAVEYGLADCIED